MRQMNGAVWGPLFSVSLDFQCELVLDTSLRFHTTRSGGRSSRQPSLPNRNSGSSSSSRRKGGRRGLIWHVLDILATQWVPDVFAIFAWYGLYTWLPLRWPGTTVREELLYVAASIGVAVGCYAAQFVLAGWVDAYYPRGGSSSSSSSSSSSRRVERGGSMSSSSGSRGRGRRSASQLGMSSSSSNSVNGGPPPLPAPPPPPTYKDNALCVFPPFLSGKYLAELLLYLWAFTAANLLWVFFWDLLDDHFLPSHPLLSNWLCAVGGLSLEFILNVASTEVAGGVYLDGAGEGSSGLFFPVCYFGEVAAYRASLKSASTYALYRRSTAAVIMAASLSQSQSPREEGEEEGGDRKSVV